MSCTRAKNQTCHISKNHERERVTRVMWRHSEKNTQERETRHDDFDKKHIAKHMSNDDNYNHASKNQTTHRKIRSVAVNSFIFYLPCSLVFFESSDALPCWSYCRRETTPLFVGVFFIYVFEKLLVSILRCFNFLSLCQIEYTYA